MFTVAAGSHMCGYARACVCTCFKTQTYGRSYPNGTWRAHVKNIHAAAICIVLCDLHTFEYLYGIMCSARARVCFASSGAQPQTQYLLVVFFVELTQAWWRWFPNAFGRACARAHASDYNIWYERKFFFMGSLGIVHRKVVA